MSPELDIKTLIAQTNTNSPLEGRAVMPFLRTPHISASFSKDIMPLGGIPAIYYHLSIGHVKDDKPDYSELLTEFKNEFGEPVMTFDTIPSWTIRGRQHPMLIHHFFWKSSEKP